MADIKNKNCTLELYQLNDNGRFPNSKLPVIIYRQALELPMLFAANSVRKLFKKHNWKNSWKSGVFEYHHYHSVTHEVLGIFSGRSILLFGGEQGVKVQVEKGDVVIIPAGVAHKNLGKENDLVCIGAYPDGKDYDINYGKAGERPMTDENIRSIPLPAQDPVFGNKAGLKVYWKNDR